jgi:molecular chaperone GrpE
MFHKNNDDTKEDIVYDNSDTPDLETGISFENDAIKKIKKLKSDLKKCQSEKQEYLDGWQRAKADFINFKKRSEESKKELLQYASENIILEIIPTLDNFEQAMKNKEVWESVDENWRKGIEMIHSQLLDVLKRNGVTDIESLGEKFDPKMHESVETVEVEDVEDNDKIIEVTLKGYQIGDKVIRHPNVKVGEFK